MTSSAIIKFVFGLFVNVIRNLQVVDGKKKKMKSKIDDNILHHFY